MAAAISHGETLLVDKYDVENSARDARLGLWALPKAVLVEPWVWRKMSAEEHDAIRAIAARIQPQIASPVSASKQETAPLVCECRRAMRRYFIYRSAASRCWTVPCETLCR
jgi:hypothetical protein